MTFTSMTLTDAASGLSAVLMPRDGVAVMTFDLQPSVRAVSEERVGGGGTVDTTTNLSEAALTLTLRVINDVLPLEQLLAGLGPLLSPARRPALVCEDDQWLAPRQLTVRFDSKTAPVDNPVTTDVAISWKVPAGAWEDAAATEYIIGASAPSTTGMRFTVTTGMTFTATTGMTFPASTSAADSLVTNPGDLPAAWTARLYGPCTGPKLYNDTSGLVLAFTDSLVLGAGQYVEVDVAARTARLLSDPASGRLQDLDFAVSDWWLLEAGTSLLRYAATASSPGAAAVLDFTPRYVP